MTIVVSAVYGLLFGSFLTVVVDRVPRGASIVTPGSACGNCDLRLGARDLVPVFSWLVLRGKCRRCKVSIGTEPLVLEIVTSTLFALMAWHFGLRWALPGYCFLAAGLVALAWIDLKIQRLPREITYTTAAVGIPFLVIDAFVRHEPRRLWMLALGAAIALAIMGLIYVASRGGMGSGDVRLSPLLGAFLGFINPGLAPIGLFFGFFFGGVVGAVLLATKRAGRRSTVPFGPFLVLGTILAIFIGQRWIDIILVRGH